MAESDWIHIQTKNVRRYLWERNNEDPLTTDMGLSTNYYPGDAIVEMKDGTVYKVPMQAFEGTLDGWVQMGVTAEKIDGWPYRDVGGIVNGGTS